MTRLLLKAISLLSLLAGWQVVAAVAGPLAVPTPLATAGALLEVGADSAFLAAVGHTTWVFALGFCAAVVTGIVVGLVTGYVRVLTVAFDLALDVFLAVPVVALIPLLVVWQGLTASTQVIIVFLSAVFPIVVNTQLGVQARSSSLRAVGRVFAANRLHEFTAMVLPAAVPAIAAGVRIGVGRAVIGVFVADLFTAATGLGARMQYYSTYFQTDRYFAGLVTLVALALLAAGVSDLVTRRWNHPTIAPREV